MLRPSVCYAAAIIKMFLSGLIVLGLAQFWQSKPVAADSVVVGTGTPASFFQVHKQLVVR
ncbi:hypothetical protein [Herpetosiphon geysericola]|uniref:Uncharacterized protein n=1 Tax=Herpetosiphon geysericola TaxID=70996 RepID=A0A0P6Y3E7_9CHLR|nr:hypothetical protein [Herpetosiphon geysericola]KPL90428.1 hypothetical protein SE18_07435 [Herpetosiphon geysericola]